MALLLDRIRELGLRVPDAPALAFVDEGGGVVESMSRAEVVAEAVWGGRDAWAGVWFGAG